jgi:flavin-dependent dehydrogenase
VVEVDVVIVGGGPAGCSAALSLLARGHSVAVVSMPNRREKPTETSAPALKQMLQLLGAEIALSACEPCFGIVSDWARNTPVLQPGMISPFGHPWFIHRPRFDECLQQLVLDRGALWIKAQVQRVEFNTTGVVVRMADGLIKARWLIAANGSPSWTANITHQLSTIFDSLIAFWAYLPTAINERLLCVEVANYGWWYMCPGDGTGVFACCVTDALEARLAGIAQISVWNKLFQATNLSQQLGGRVTGGTINVASASTAFLPRQHGNGWVAVGDAAVKLDPLGSSGTTTALDSGQRAANAVVDAINGNLATIQKYANWSAGLVNTFTRQRMREYELEAQKNNAIFWGRRSNTNKER